MKLKSILLFIGLLFNSIANGDLIILKTGSTLNVYNVDVGKTNVFYTETDDLNADSKRVPVAEVFAVKIGDGEITSLSSTGPTKSESPTENTANETNGKAQAAADNANLIAQYSRGDYSIQDKKTTDKDAKVVMAFYRLTPESVLSTPELTVDIEVGGQVGEKWQNFETALKFLSNLRYRISLQNKTNRPIYVDLSKCFRSGNILPTKTFYDGTQVTESTGKSTGVGIAVLGVGIGASSGTSSSITKTQQAIMMIPPHGSVFLPGEKRYSDFYKKVVEDYEIYTHYDPLLFQDELLGIKQLEKRIYTIDEAFGFINYMITYSDNENFSAPKTLDFSFYIQQVIGAKPGALGVGFKDELSKIINADSKTIGGLIRFYR